MNKLWLRMLLLSAALFTSISLGFTWSIAAESQKAGKSEVSETQTSDAEIVEANDWAYQALKSLNDRYGCLDNQGISLENNPLTRNQYIIALQTCVPTVLNHPAITPEDLTTLEQLRKDFPEGFISTEVQPPEEPQPAPTTAADGTSGETRQGPIPFSPPTAGAPIELPTVVHEVEEVGEVILVIIPMHRQARSFSLRKKRINIIGKDIA
jgi:hypothetical protein